MGLLPSRKPVVRREGALSCSEKRRSCHSSMALRISTPAHTLTRLPYVCSPACMQSTGQPDVDWAMGVGVDTDMTGRQPGLGDCGLLGRGRRKRAGAIRLTEQYLHMQNVDQPQMLQQQSPLLHCYMQPSRVEHSTQSIHGQHISPGQGAAQPSTKPGAGDVPKNGRSMRAHRWVAGAGGRTTHRACAWCPSRRRGARAGACCLWPRA